MKSDKARAIICTIAVLGAMALVVLDAGIVNIALPTIAGALNVVPAQSILIISVYQVALIMGLLPCAHLADYIGYRRMFIAGIAIFSCASACCAFANSLPLLVAARFAQGLGGSAIMALGIALLRFALGPARLGQAIGWNALTVALCSAAAPTIGALVLSSLSWPWLFLINLPFCIVVLVSVTALPKVEPTRLSVDVSSMALLALSAGMLFAAAELSVSRTIIATFSAIFGSLCLLLLMHRQAATEAPVFPKDLLAQRPFRLAVIASGLCFTGQSIGLVALPFYLQTGLHQGPLSAGLTMTSWPLAAALSSTLANQLNDRFGTAAICAAGGSAMALGLLVMAAWPLQGSVLPLAFGAFLCGAGFALFQVPNNRVMFLSVPLTRSAATGGMQGTARLTGQTLGGVIMTLLFTLAEPDISSRLGFAIGLVFALAAALMSVLRVPTDLSRNGAAESSS